jgi:hypothetical protein
MLLAGCQFSVPGIGDEMTGGPGGVGGPGDPPVTTPGGRGGTPVGLPAATPGPCDTSVPAGGDVQGNCAQVAPVIDGDLSDWPQALFSNEVRHRSAGYVAGTWSSDEKLNDDDSSATWAVRWDMQHLYVAVHATDDDRRTGPQMLSNDGIAIYLDGAHDRSESYGTDDLELAVSATGTAWLLRNLKAQPMVAGAQFKTRDVPSQGKAGFDIEVAIPWAALGSQPPSPGRVLGYTLQIHDVDREGGGPGSGGGNSTSTKYMLWKRESPTACDCYFDACFPWCSTQPFAALQLAGK